MPIYDFACKSCGFKAELMRKISEPSQAACPNCNKDTFAKMLSAPSFQLSGSGWYSSDFKDKKQKISDKNIDKASEKSAEKTTEKAIESNTKTAACNSGCACH